MSQPPNRDYPGVFALVLLGPVSCLGLPLLVAAGAGAGVWVIGAGLPLAAAVVLGGILITRWRRARSYSSIPRAGHVISSITSGKE